MKRVMILTNSLTGGGAERSMNLVSNELKARGWDISLVPINSGPADLVKVQCEVFPLDRDLRGTLRQTVYAIVKLNKTIRQWKPDILILNCDLPELLGSFTFKRVKFVAVEHSSIPWIQRRRLGLLVRTILEWRGVTWVAVSSHFSIWPKEEKPTAILKNPLNKLQKDSQRFDSQFSALRLLFVGRLSTEKQPAVALEIAAETGLPLLVIGDGAMRKELEKSAETSDPPVEFLGHISQPWLEARKGDLLVVPSVTEGDGLVVLEAAQRGIPLLIADIPDFRRFLFPEVNYCKDISDFVKKIREHRNNLTELVIPFDSVNAIVDSRSLLAIGNDWEKFLHNL